MSKIADIIENLVKITANFANLSEQVLRIEERVNDHSDRIARLETSRDAMYERVRSEVVTGISQLETRYIERLVKVEIEIAALKTSNHYSRSGLSELPPRLQEDINAPTSTGQG